MKAEARDIINVCKGAKTQEDRLGQETRLQKGDHSLWYHDYGSISFSSFK